MKRGAHSRDVGGWGGVHLGHGAFSDNYGTLFCLLTEFIRFTEENVTLVTKVLKAWEDV